MGGIVGKVERGDRAVIAAEHQAEAKLAGRCGFPFGDDDAEDDLFDPGGDRGEGRRIDRGGGAGAAVQHDPAAAGRGRRDEAGLAGDLVGLVRQARNHPRAAGAFPGDRHAHHWLANREIGARRQGFAGVSRASGLSCGSVLCPSRRFSSPFALITCVRRARPRTQNR